jgi:hypothetical protein
MSHVSYICVMSLTGGSQCTLDDAAPHARQRIWKCVGKCVAALKVPQRAGYFECNRYIFFPPRTCPQDLGLGAACVGAIGKQPVSPFDCGAQRVMSLTYESCFLHMSHVSYIWQVNNLFDLLIVVLSAVEIPSTIQSAQCKLGSQSLRDCEVSTNFMIFRVLRLLRLARVLRAFPNFQAQVAVAVQVFAEIAASFSLLCLFLAVYSILGASLFGGRLREQFDSEEVGVGQRLFVRLPLETRDQAAILVGYDPHTHPFNPWQVVCVCLCMACVRMHVCVYVCVCVVPSWNPILIPNPWQVAVVGGFLDRIDQAKTGYVWVSSSSSASSLGHDSGIIVGVSPRSGFDTLLQSVVTGLF